MKKRMLGMLCALCLMVASFSQKVSAGEGMAECPLGITMESSHELETLKLYDDVFTAEKNVRYCSMTVHEMASLWFNVNSDAKGEVKILNSKGQTLAKWKLRGEKFKFVNYYEYGTFDPTALLYDGDLRCLGEGELLEPGKYYLEITADKEQFTEEVKEIGFQAIASVRNLKPSIRLDRTNAVYTGKKVPLPKVRKLEGAEAGYKPDKTVKYDEIIDWGTGRRVKSMKKIGKYLICDKYFCIEPNELHREDQSCALFTVSPQKGVLKTVKSKKAGQLQITAKENKAAGSYQIQVSTDKKFKKDVQTFDTKRVKQTVKNLKSGKKYYVRVRYYKNVSVKYIHGKGTPQPIYGKWSKTKPVLVK